MFSKSACTYIPLANKPSSRRTTDEDDGHIYSKPQHYCSIYHWIVHCMTFSTISFILASSRHHNKDSWTYCWDLHHYFSPINEGVSSLPFVEKRFNGSLWHPSPFKGPPTPQTEVAWHSVMQYGMIGVEASDIEAAGHNITTASRFPESAGGQYVAVAVGTHQLHCLHYVWQDHHQSFFDDVRQKIEDIPEMYERHYEHCIDYIRQSLMCNFDTTLVTYDWVLDHQNPTPNSNAMHKCVDWDGVQDWLEGKAVRVPEDFVWLQPEDQESLPWNP